MHEFNFELCVMNYDGVFDVFGCHGCTDKKLKLGDFYVPMW